MKSLVAYLASTNPIFKVALYAQLISLAIWGPLSSCIGIVCITFFILALYRGEKGYVAGPYFGLIFCGFSVLIVLPGGTMEDILIAINIALRLFDVMLVSAILGLILKPQDIISLGKTIRLPESAVFLMVAVSRFIPVASKTIRSITLAQRSRGFSFNLSSLFKIQTYKALIVPYLVCILNSATLLWISMNLRPTTNIGLPRQKISFVELSILILSLGLWFG